MSSARTAWQSKRRAAKRVIQSCHSSPSSRLTREELGDRDMPAAKRRPLRRTCSRAGRCSRSGVRDCAVTRIHHVGSGGRIPPTAQRVRARGLTRRETVRAGSLTRLGYLRSRLADQPASRRTGTAQPRKRRRLTEVRCEPHGGLSIAVARKDRGRRVAEQRQPCEALRGTLRFLAPETVALARHATEATSGRMTHASRLVTAGGDPP